MLVKFSKLLLSFILILTFIYAAEFSLDQNKLQTLKSSIDVGIELMLQNSPDGKIPYYKLGQEKVTTSAVAHFLLLSLAMKENDIFPKTLDLNALKEYLLQWQWTSANAKHGIKDMQKDASGITNYVLESVTGVTAVSAQCKKVNASFNMWHFSSGPNNINLETDLKTTAIASAALLKYWRLYDNDTAFNAAKNAGSALLQLLVVPDSENEFGIKKSLLKDSAGGEIVTGILPCEFRMLGNDDTASCGDGAYVRYYSIYKDQLASAAAIFYNLSETNIQEKSKFKKAYNYLLKGIFSIKECDGLIANYARFQGPNAAENECYADNIVTLTSRELLFDTVLILYYLQIANPYIYLEDSNFADSLKWILQIENASSGIRKNADTPYRYGSSTIALSRRPLARAMLSALFLRAACFEDDSQQKELFKTTAKNELNLALEELPIKFTEKPSNLFSEDTVFNTLGFYAFTELYEIFTKGCSKAPDNDKDGYYDDPKLELRDCNDFDANVHPNATELCNGIDDDCDGLVDEGFDKDNDGFTVCQNDCNDDDAEVHPGTTEKFNGKDDDCDGLIDEKSITISTLDNNNVGLASLPLYIFDLNCAKDNNYSFKDANANCEAAKCKTTNVGICDIVLQAGSYVVYWFEADKQYYKDFNVGEKTARIELRKKTVRLTLSQNYTQPRKTPMTWFISMSYEERTNFITLLSIIMLTLFILVLVLSLALVLLTKFGISFKGFKLPKIGSEEKELKEVHKRFAFKKK